jgi:hypothetical protein
MKCSKLQAVPVNREVRYSNICPLAIYVHNVAERERERTLKLLGTGALTRVTICPKPLR